MQHGREAQAETVVDVACGLSSGAGGISTEPRPMCGPFVAISLQRINMQIPGCVLLASTSRHGPLPKWRLYLLSLLSSLVGNAWSLNVHRCLRCGCFSFQSRLMLHKVARNRMPIRCVLLVITAGLLVAGCERTATPPGTAADVPPRTADQSVVIPPDLFPASESAPAGKPVADKSLTSDQYIALGIPATDRTWMGEDMKAAADTLVSLAAQHPEQLPRFESPRSGAVFSRIISAENLGFFREQKLPLESRFPGGVAYLQSHSSILGTYLKAFLKHQCSENEMMELMGSNLRACHMMLDLVDEFWPTLSRDDPSYPVRVRGLEQMRSGLANVVVGSMTALTEEQTYSLAVRLKLLKYCREEFPTIVPKLGHSSQAEVQQKLIKLAGDPKLKPLREQFRLLRDETIAALKIVPRQG